MLVRFRTDDPGSDRRLRFWLRADDFRTGSTFAQNGYGIEIDTSNRELKLIQSKDSSSTTLETIVREDSTDWQWLRFQVDGNELKAKVWQGEAEEPEGWDIEASAATVIPFSERVQSGKSVGVPGTVLGLEMALLKWGTKERQELMEPAIQMAEEGVEINWVLANAIESNREKLLRSHGKDIFFDHNGNPLAEGELLVQKDLAKTFSLIAEKGAEVFYQGEIGQAIAETVQEHNGSMTLTDLEQYQISEHDPIWGNYQGYHIATMPPPSSGGLTMLQLLNMAEELELTQYDVRSSEKYHYLAEGMRLAYADRGAYMGDPEYVDVPKKVCWRQSIFQNGPG